MASQSAPKDGVLLCEVSHHRPSNKLTSPNQPSLNLNKKNNSEKPNKTNITDEKMHRAKPLHQRSYLRRIKGGHQNCRVGSMARANQPQKMVCFGCIFHHSPASLHSKIDPSKRNKEETNREKNSRQKEGNNTRTQETNHNASRSNPIERNK